MKCERHPDRDSIGRCVSCGRGICTECKVSVESLLHCRECAESGRITKTPEYKPQPVYPIQPPPEPPPKPWKYGNPRSIGKICLAVGILGCATYFFIADMAFRLVSDARITEVMFENANNVGFYLGTFAGYFCLCALAGVVLAVVMRGIKIEFKIISHLILILPAVVTLLTATIVLVLPGVRAVLIVMPAMGFCMQLYGLATSRYSGLVDAQKGASSLNLQMITGTQCIITMVIAVLVEVFMIALKFTGSIATYMAFLALGLLILGEGGWMFWRCNKIADEQEKNAPPPPYDPNRPAPAKPSKGPISNPIGVMVVIAILLSLAFMPPLDKLCTGPELKILENEGNLHTNSIGITATIVNEGGIAADGEIQLRVVNATLDLLVDSTDHIDGFGNWKVSETVRFPQQNDTGKKRYSWDLYLYYRGELVQKKDVHFPGGCVIVGYLIMSMITSIWLVGPAVRSSPRKRKR